jgi:hypothetical protein
MLGRYRPLIVEFWVVSRLDFGGWPNRGDAAGQTWLFIRRRARGTLLNDADHLGRIELKRHRQQQILRSGDLCNVDDKPAAAIPVLPQLLKAKMAERDVCSIACHLNYSACTSTKASQTGQLPPRYDKYRSD